MVRTHAQMHLLASASMGAPAHPRLQMMRTHVQAHPLTREPTLKCTRSPVHPCSQTHIFNSGRTSAQLHLHPCPRVERNHAQAQPLTSASMLANTHSSAPVQQRVHGGRAQVHALTSASAFSSAPVQQRIHAGRTHAQAHPLNASMPAGGKKPGSSARAHHPFNSASMPAEPTLKCTRSTLHPCPQVEGNHAQVHPLTSPSMPANRTKPR